MSDLSLNFPTIHHPFTFSLYFAIKKFLHFPIYDLLLIALFSPMDSSTFVYY